MFNLLQKIIWIGGLQIVVVMGKEFAFLIALYMPIGMRHVHLVGNFLNYLMQSDLSFFLNALMNI